ncbi:MAG TPA: FecR domain-containing protein [Chitinophagaceae bacterium]|jgi:ferric-dicitrate binding protein FerR (iron transport regulator)|nr:FecR domain-containing protein [Chitinophagaceae bacterium]
MTDEMYSLLGRYFAGQASAEEVVAVEKWKAESEANKATFTELESLWNRSEEAEAITFDTNKAWNKVNSVLQSTSNNQSSQPARIVKFPLWKRAVAAASILILATVAWLLFDNMRNKKENSIVADTLLKEVVLEDGSHVWLRQGSSLNDLRNFSRNNRELSFKGEAFFDIAKDPAHPFIINSGKAGRYSDHDAAVKVLGTSFTVTNNENGISVVVKTGRVSLESLKNSNEKVLLEPGEKGVFENGQVSKLVNDDVNYNSWQTDTLRFNNTRLINVALAISRHYRIDLRIRKSDEETLGPLLLSAQFAKEKVDTVFKVIETVLPVNIVKRGEGVYEIVSAPGQANK